MKKWVAVLAVILMAAVCSAAMATEISPENFPDEVFLNLVSEFDLDHDGFLSDDEISLVKEISCPGAGIGSLKGIEVFTALEELYCKTNLLTELDVSANTKLEVLDATQNAIEKLDVSKNTRLRDLWVTENGLKQLDLSQNKKLERLGCAYTFISALDISSNKLLSELYCDNTNIQTLDVSKSAVLTKLVKTKERVNSGNGYDSWSGKAAWLYVGSDVTVKAGTFCSYPTTEAPIVTVGDMVFEISRSEAVLRSVTNPDLKKLTIPDTVKYGKKNYKVTTVNHFACQNMAKLTTVKFGKYVKVIGNAAFQGCTRLKTVTGGDLMQTIGGSAFEGCKALKEYTLGEKVKSVGRKAFYKCTALRTLTVKTEKLTSSSIGASAFGKTGIATVKCPKSKKTYYKKIFVAKGVSADAAFKKIQ